MKRNSWNDCLSGSWGLSPDSDCHWIVFVIFASLGPNFFLHETGLDYTVPLLLFCSPQHQTHVHDHGSTP